VIFIVAMCAVSSVYAYVLGPSGQRSLLARTATNLVNLRSDLLGTLVASAFVSETAPWVWVGFAAAGLFPLAYRFGNPRALLLVGAAHVIGTLLSEGLLAWRISAGAEPVALRTIDDVGPSYVIASALLATILYGTGPATRTPACRLFDRIASRWWRLLAAAGLIALAPSLFEGIGRLDVAAVGHVVALTTGAAVGLLLTRRERRVRVLDLTAEAGREAREDAVRRPPAA
jgi:hypothetical protein